MTDYDDEDETRVNAPSDAGPKQYGDTKEKSNDGAAAGARYLLPRARWGEPLPRYEITEEEHDLLKKRIGKMLSNLLNGNNYDSVNNFILFHDNYVDSGLPLDEFFEKYDPPIRSSKHTCVGLGLELMNRMKVLDITFKDLSKSISLISCEESVNDSIATYVTSAEGPHEFPYISAEKEHVMVGIQILVDGRKGCMIADPGYHVGRVVTVMHDELSPHTGFFVQHDTDLLVKEYHYVANTTNQDYVEWHERELKNGKYKYQISLVYTGRPYLTAVEVTEKRNLIYVFKSQLRRDPQGNVIAGYYFPLCAVPENASFTVFVGLKAKAKYKFSDFIDVQSIHPAIIKKIEFMCNYMNCSHVYIIKIISKLANIHTNTKFIQDVIELNKYIHEKCIRPKDTTSGNAGGRTGTNNNGKKVNSLPVDEKSKDSNIDTKNGTSDKHSSSDMNSTDKKEPVEDDYDDSFDPCRPLPEIAWVSIGEISPYPFIYEEIDENLWHATIDDDDLSDDNVDDTESTDMLSE